MKITVLFSLPSERMKATDYSTTDDDSKVIADKVAEGLRFKEYEVELLSVSEHETRKIGEIKSDLVFNLIEWCGQDIHLAQKAFGELRKLNIPVTGSDEKRFVLTGDKAKLKKVLLPAGISTPNGVTLTTGNEEIPTNLSYPMIIKPSCEHCSMGLSYDSIVNNKTRLRTVAKNLIATFRQPALAEEFIEGREFMVYLIEEKDGVKVLPIEEVIFNSTHPTPFQTYETKWDENSAEYNSTDVVVAQLRERDKLEIENEAKKTFQLLGIWGYGRFDMRLRNGKAFIIEANANPSVYDGDTEMKEINSEVIWGIKFPNYLGKIVQAAIRHYECGERV